MDLAEMGVFEQDLIHLCWTPLREVLLRHQLGSVMKVKTPSVKYAEVQSGGGTKEKSDSKENTLKIRKHTGRVFCTVNLSLERARSETSLFS